MANPYLVREFVFPNKTTLRFWFHKFNATSPPAADGRYFRSMLPTEWKAPVVPLHYTCGNPAQSNAATPFPPGTYEALLDGNVIQTYTIPVGNTKFETSELGWTINLAGVEDLRWYILELRTTGIISHPHWVFVNKTGGPVTIPQDWIPVQSDSQAIEYVSPKERVWLFMIPNQPSVAVPMPTRTAEHFNTALSGSQLYRQNLGLVESHGIYSKAITRTGLVTTNNLQAYYWSKSVQRYPEYPLLDGPRNIATFMSPTHIEPSRRVNGGAIACDFWRVCRIRPDGEVNTLAGYRHRLLGPYNLPTSWEVGQGVNPDTELELIGDWSSIPKERHGFHEIWGFTWDARTLELDETVPPIGPPANLIGFEQPHKVGPVGFVADSQMNRIVKLQFSPIDHSPPVVTEFITGINDSWDVVYHKGSLYVSERKDNRICEYDARTGAFKRVVVSGPSGLATVDSSRIVHRHTTIANIRLENCILPEGLDILPDDDWLYYGSIASQEVKKVNVVTGEIVHNVARHSNGTQLALYLKIAVSDGSFGPRGTVFTTNWTNYEFGWPKATLPDGTVWDFHSYAGPRIEGRGSRWDNFDYSAAVAVGKAANGDSGGRLFCGASNYGIVCLSKAKATDPVTDESKLARGRTYYYAQGYNYTHGYGGFNKHGLPPPWGENADTDYYLTVAGRDVDSGEEPPPEPVLQPVTSSLAATWLIEEQPIEEPPSSTASFTADVVIVST